MTDSIYIVAGGPSLSGFNFSSLAGKETIAVNKAIFDVKNPTYFITMDYTFLKKIDIERFRGIKVPKFFVVNFAAGVLAWVDGVIKDVRFGLVYDLKDFTTIQTSSKASGIGTKWDDFRSGTNSGFCAFQLAILFGYKKIYLLGVDLSTKSATHYHGGYGESIETFNKKCDGYLQHWTAGIKELKIAKPEVQVYSCSPVSRLNTIIQYTEFKC